MLNNYTTDFTYMQSTFLQLFYTVHYVIIDTRFSEHFQSSLKV